MGCIWVKWLVHMCDMIASCVATGPVYMCDDFILKPAKRGFVNPWHYSFIPRLDCFTCVTRHIYMCDPTQSNVWHDSILCVIHCLVSHSSFTKTCEALDCKSAIRLFFVRKKTANNVRLWYMIFVRLFAAFPQFETVTWLLFACDVTFSHVLHNTSTCRWHNSKYLRSVGLQNRALLPRSTAGEKLNSKKGSYIRKGKRHI